MGLKKITILFKITLINFVFIACVCHAAAKKGGKPGSGGGGGGGEMVMPPAIKETCTCETFSNLCQSSGQIDIRISNHEQTELTCNQYEYRYCNLPKLTCSYRRIRSPNDLFGKHPWHVSIYDTSKTPKFIGSGVLIKKQYVLTVAHKVIPYLKTGVNLRLGEWDRYVSASCEPLQFKSSKIVIHPKYDDKKNHINDIALIKLNKEVDISQNPSVNTACLVSKMPEPGSHCVVAGWGADTFVSPSIINEPPSLSTKLQEVIVPIVSHADCETALRKTRLKQAFKLDEESFICAGGEIGRDSCSGDGGAPLMCPNSQGVLEVVGLVVGGIGCNSPVPALHTNILSYKSWIEDSIFASLDD